MMRRYFYPRSPCGERLPRSRAVSMTALFLSTLSLRRATADVVSVQHGRQNFYPRSPCGERLQTGIILGCILNFYPRSPCGERLGGAREEFAEKIFLSTLSLRRATTIFAVRPYDAPIFLSTLSLRRATLVYSFLLTRFSLFLSTLSLRRATYLINTYHRIFGISIHALLAESD